MYSTSKGGSPTRWRTQTYYSRQIAGSRKRLFLLVGLVIVLTLWRSHASSYNVLQHRSVETSSSAPDFPKSLQKKATYRSETEIAQHTLVDSKSSSSSSKDAHKSKSQDVVSKSQFQKMTDALNQKIEDTKMQIRKQSPFKQTAAYEDASANELVNDEAARPKSKKLTPEESDDEALEPDLKTLAVSRSGKDVPDGIAKSPSTQEQRDVTSSSKAEGAKINRTDGSDALTFATLAQFNALDELADKLPDIAHFSFQDSTLDIVLQGWEDAWFSEAVFDASQFPKLEEPKIDFVYTWVNGSEKAFLDTILPYEMASSLNDEEGKWLESHGTNRYRDWDELRYSIRTVERHAQTFRNKIQILVNAVGEEGKAADATPEQPATISRKQKPDWLNDDAVTNDIVQIISQEEFFPEEESGCLPTFNSLTIENQIHNTASDTDRFFSLSDDMFLGKAHAASDIYSPLFGPTMGFKTNGYNTRDPPTDLDARRFGEKPFLIYTSWLLNRRFGNRKRKGQVHFGHSMSRSVSKEAIKSFPRPALQSNCQRFRGETGFQLYSWYVAFHYTMERQREALLWSYIMLRSDINNDGNLDWDERQTILADLEEGMENEGDTTFRTRQFYKVAEHLESAGLEAPKANLDILWTSLDGPSAIRDIECLEFNANECLAPGFSSPSYDEHGTNPAFSSALIFDRVARQHPKCGDCLIKLLLNRVEKGYSPILPPKETMPSERETVIKALFKYQYSIIEPDAQFVMVTDAEQVKHQLLKRFVDGKKEVGQLCLNDDVITEDPAEIESLRKAMMKLFKKLGPERSQFEKELETELQSI